MEQLTLLLGLVMIYAWCHTGYLMATKMKKLTGYEVFITIAGAVGFALYIMGTINQ